ncbi:hypothetical protein D9M68_903640 [compost metagenome]
MVGMPAAIVDDRRAQRRRKAVQSPQQVLDRQFGERAALQRRVQVVHVGLVVLAVVDLHGQRIDMRFQGGVAVRQLRQCMRHADFSQW